MSRLLKLRRPLKRPPRSLEQPRWWITERKAPRGAARRDTYLYTMARSRVRGVWGGSREKKQRCSGLGFDSFVSFYGVR
jgi:hypothetical protein